MDFIQRTFVKININSALFITVLTIDMISKVIKLRASRRKFFALIGMLGIGATLGGISAHAIELIPLNDSCQDITDSILSILENEG